VETQQCNESNRSSTARAAAASATACNCNGKILKKKTFDWLQLAVTAGTAAVLPRLWESKKKRWRRNALTAAMQDSNDPSSEVKKAKCNNQPTATDLTRTANGYCSGIPKTSGTVM